MRVGILSPKSLAHQGLGMEFLEGLGASLHQQGIREEVTLSIENIGFGNSEKEIYSAVEKMLFLDRADIIVAFIDLRVLSIIEPLILSTGKLLVVVNPGANYPQNWVPQPTIIFLTLQDAFLCWLTGKLAYEQAGNNAVVASSFYDCGYLHIAAISNSFVETGGSINYNYINNQPYNADFNIDQLVGFLQESKEAQSLLCIFDAYPASLFYQLLQTNIALDGKPLNLFVSPTMLEKSALDSLSNDAQLSVAGYGYWDRSEANLAADLIVKALNKNAANDLSVFSLLGWETGLLIDHLLKLKIPASNGVDLCNSLVGATLETPRGALFFDEQTHYFVAPSNKIIIKSDANFCQIEEQDKTRADWDAFIKMPLEGLNSGWLNTYLCY